MQICLLALRTALRNLLVREEGQDLVEYALIVALIALGATTAMGTLATAISNAFSAVGSTITGDI